MEWNLGGAGNAGAAKAFNDGNPWTSPIPAASSSNSNAGSPSASDFAQHRNPKSNLPANPLYQGSPELGSFSDKEPPSGPKLNNGILNPEATRPTLFRLTSGGLNGLLHGLDSLGFANASQESLSTDDTGPNGTRRSLDELRRLSIKGKGRAVEDDNSHNDLLGEESLRPTKRQMRGREALLHLVEEGDTLQRLALLYGCTVPAIRSANKMWAKDPIYPRKTLYIPLDVCKQPPSKEVEFVHKSGEDQVEMYFCEAKPASTTSSFAHISGKNGMTASAGRSRSDSLRLGAFADSTRPLTPYRDSPGSGPVSPGSSRRSSHEHSRQTSSSTYFNYLSSTNSEYDASDDDPRLLPNNNVTTSSHDSFTSNHDFPGANTASDDGHARHHAEKTHKKTLQIVQIPGSKMAASTSSAGASRQQARSPLIAVDNLEDPDGSARTLPSHDAVISVSSTSLGTLNGSNDRLNALSGTPANLRMRPKSPYDASLPTATSSDSRSSSPLARPPNRTRKISKDSNPHSATSSRSTSTFPKLPGSLGKYITSAGAGLVSSIMGERSESNSGWLATNELETEMQMAREYQTRHQHRTSISSERTLHARSRSQASLRGHPSPSGGPSGQRVSSMSADRS